MRISIAKRSKRGRAAPKRAVCFRSGGRGVCPGCDQWRLILPSGLCVECSPTSVVASLPATPRPTLNYAGSL